MQEYTIFHAIVNESASKARAHNFALGFAEGFAEGYAEGFAEGRVQEARWAILCLGQQRFYAPSEETKVAIEAVSSVERLEQLVERLLEVESWDELLSKD